MATLYCDMRREELKELLERLHDEFNNEAFIEADPISVPHSFTSRGDIEIAGFMAAAIASCHRQECPPHDALYG